MSEKVIEARDIVVRYNGVTVLDHVSLDVMRGRFPGHRRTERRRQDHLA